MGKLPAYAFVLGMGLSALATSPALAIDQIDVTLLHTNDLHSHFRAQRDALGLGGIARLKTLIDRERARTPRSFLLDGGDWSEGDIYFREGAGTETLRMMDHLGYDAVVVGNHDWLNGPEALLSILERSTPRFSVVAANIDADGFGRRDDLTRLIPPYSIREVNGIRVAFIGLVTYEKIYDAFLRPVEINQPFLVARQLSNQLKEEADLVVVISHNGLRMNEAILRAAPNVDVIIGGHDHNKTVEPIVVDRGGKPGYLVEAGDWGQYLGKLDLRVRPRTLAEAAGEPRLELAGYQLLQVDSRTPEDPTTLARVENLERLLENRYGPIFHDHVATSETEVRRDGIENLMGNFATDAYMRATGADLSLDQVALIYGQLHEGDLRSVDLYNANPGVYSPVTDKSWTLKVIPVKGRTLKWVLNLLFSTRQIAELGILSASGLELTYDPLLQQRMGIDPTTDLASFLALDGGGQKAGEQLDADDANSIIEEILIGGQPLERDRIYRLGASGGVEAALRFLNSVIPRAVPLDDMVETGIEAWRAMADHARAISPITPDKIPSGHRIRSVQPDLAVRAHDIQWTPLAREGNRLRARVQVTVRNYGRTPAAGAVAGVGPSVSILGNSNGTDMTRDPDWIVAGAAKPLGAIAPQGSQTFEWEVLLPGDRGLYSVTAAVEGLPGEVNRANNRVTRWVRF